MSRRVLPSVLLALWQVIAILGAFTALAWLAPVSTAVHVAVLVAAVIVSVGLAVAGSALVDVPPAPAETPRRLAAHAASPDRPEDPDLLSQRAALVEASIAVADVVPSDALRTRLLEGLAAAGVTAIAVDGTRFDPELHRGVGVVSTDDPSLVGTVAATERAGYRDGTTLIRPPDVVVYRAGANE